MSESEEVRAAVVDAVAEGMSKSADLVEFMVPTWRRLGHEERAIACEMAAKSIRELIRDTRMLLGKKGGSA